MPPISITYLKTKSAMKISHLELHLVELAKEEIKKNPSLEQLNRTLQTELVNWKTTRDKYKNASTQLEHRYSRMLFLKNNGLDLVVFESSF